MAEKHQRYSHHYNDIKFCASAFAGIHSLAKIDHSGGVVKSANQYPIIFVNWHCRLLAIPAMLKRDLPTAYIISESHDGQLISGTVKPLSWIQSGDLGATKPFQAIVICGGAWQKPACWDHPRWPPRASTASRIRRVAIGQIIRGCCGARGMVNQRYVAAEFLGSAGHPKTV